MKSARALIECSDAYLAVFDRGAPCNRAGHYEESWDKAWDFERASPGAFKGATGSGDLEQAGDRFQQYWNQRMLAGELLVWNPGTGVYRVEARLLPPRPRQKLPDQKTISVPTGKLLIASLNELGRGSAELLVLPRGDYRASLETQEIEHKKHWLMKDPASYPPADGPDFILTLQKG